MCDALLMPTHLSYAVSVYDNEKFATFAIEMHYIWNIRNEFTDESSHFPDKLLMFCTLRPYPHDRRRAEFID